MALIKCKKCGQMVSDKADKCPKCGCSISENEVSDVIRHDTHKEKQIAKKNDKQILLGSVIAFLVIALGGGIWWHLNNNEKNVKITPELSKAIKKYEKLGGFYDGLALALHNGKWGYIDTKGREVIPCQFIGEERGGWGHNFSDGMAIIIKEGKYGYINKKGSIIINPQYYEAADFSNGVAAVMREQDGKLIFIDKENRIVEALSNKYVWDFNITRRLPKFHNGICEVHSELPQEERSEGNWVKRLWIDVKGNEVKEPQKQEDTERYEVFWEENGRKGYKDKDGNIVIPAKYSTIGEFSCGVAVATLECGEKSMWGNSPNYIGIYGYVDLNGNETFTQDDYKKIAQARRDEEERKRQEERRKWEEEQRKGPEWIDGTWYFEDNVSSSWGTMYMSARAIIDRSNTSLIVYHGSDLDYNGNYTIRDNTIYYGNGNIIPMDVSNQRLQFGNGLYYSKGTPSANGRSSQSNDNLAEYGKKIKRAKSRIDSAYRQFQQDRSSGRYNTLMPPESYYDLVNACTDLASAANQAAKIARRTGNESLADEYESQANWANNLSQVARETLGRMH